MRVRARETESSRPMQRWGWNQADFCDLNNDCSYAIGTMVWTLFDYYGEPSFGGWPFVSSTFGAFDLTGFAKAASYWFRSQWLYSIPDGRSVRCTELILRGSTGKLT